MQKTSCYNVTLFLLLVHTDLLLHFITVMNVYVFGYNFTISIGCCEIVYEQLVHFHTINYKSYYILISNNVNLPRDLLQYRNRGAIKLQMTTVNKSFESGKPQLARNWAEGSH